MVWKRTLLSTWIAQVASMSGFFLVVPFLPLFIQEELGITDPKSVRLWAGLVGAAPGLMLAIMHPVWGSLSDRYGRKPMVLRAMFSGAVILALGGLVQNVYQLVALRLLQGALTGTIAASVAMVSSVTPREKAGFSLGLMQAAVYIGLCLGALTGGLLAGLVGYRPCFFIGAAMLLSGGLCVLLFADDQFERPDRDGKNARTTFKDVVLVAGFPALVTLLFVINFAGSMLAPVMPLFVAHLLGKTQGASQHTGALFFIRGTALAVAAAGMGIASQRIGRKRIILIGLGLGALLCIPHGLAKTVRPLYLWQALLGLALGGIIPAINASVSQLFPRRLHGKAYGLLYSVGALGFAAGPIAGGAISAATNLSVPFFCCAFVLAAAIPTVAVRFGSQAGNK